MPDWFPTWCIVVVLVAIVIVFVCWLQLLVWKYWAQRYKAWVARNCECDRPGGDPEPEEPKWP